MQMRYAFELSGEHTTLPRSEVLSLLKICSTDFHEIEHLDQCLIVEASNLNYETMAQRLAMSHRIIEDPINVPASLEAVSDAVAGMALPLETYKIRARGVGPTKITGYDVERAVGKALFSRGYKANLKDPQMCLRGIVTNDRIVIGKEIAKVDRSSFESRRPHLKPFFHPGVLMPRVARALVNMSLVKRGQILLDPFSGTAGILVEACMIGISGLGVDVQAKLVKGSLSNVLGSGCSLVVGDAKRLPIRDGSIDGIVCDTPYGRSAIIKARSRDDLLDEALQEMKRVLKKKGRAVVVADRSIEDQIMSVGFSVLEQHFDRVHRSLTRQIFVCEG